MGNIVEVFNKFLPVRISDCKIWITADRSLVTLNGSTVSQINDLSGNGNHFVQGTAIDQPTLVVSGENGLNNINFDSGNDVMVNTSYNPNWNNIDFTIFSVVKKTIDENDFAGFFSIRAGAGAANWFTLGQIIISKFLTLETTAGAHPVSTTIQPYVQGLMLVTLKKSGRDIEMYVDGVSVGSADLGVSNIGGTTNEIMIGRWYSASPSSGWGGDIDEIILYEKALGDTERVMVKNYLTTKWGI